MNEILNLEDYILLRSIPGRCNRLRDDGKLCRHPDFERDDSYPENVDFCNSKHPGPYEKVSRKISTCTLTFKISQVIYNGYNGASFPCIFKYLAGNSSKPPKENTVKKILRKMIKDGKVQKGKVYIYKSSKNLPKGKIVGHIQNLDESEELVKVLRFSQSYFLCPSYKKEIKTLLKISN